MNVVCSNKYDGYIIVLCLFFAKGKAIISAISNINFASIDISSNLIIWWDIEIFLHFWEIISETFNYVCVCYFNVVLIVLQNFKFFTLGVSVTRYDVYELVRCRNFKPSVIAKSYSRAFYINWRQRAIAVQGARYYSRYSFHEQILGSALIALVAR